MEILSENHANYDSVAQSWDATRKSAWGEFEFAKHLFSASSILDAGCGNGRLVNWLRGNNFTGSYLGIDNSKSLIQKAKLGNCPLCSYKALYLKTA